MIDCLNKDRNIWYTKHVDTFDLSQDNEIIPLEIEDIKKLIPILTEFVR